MLILEGRYNTAKVFCDRIEPEAAAQIVRLLNQPFIEGSVIRIMPDMHAGAGCTIGTTMTIRDKVVPNLVGVDIGCGMETILLRESFVDLAELDRFIHAAIPSGFDTRRREHAFAADIDLSRLRCLKAVNLPRAALSIGTLGGGNHFIELDKDNQDRLYLVVHSGSRNLGKQAAEHYQQEAAQRLAGRGIERSLAYCEGKLLEDYLHDMSIIQRYADLNRKAMVEDILDGLGLHVSDKWTTIHNYIDLDAWILRKGAISARRGEKLLIPANMRDGSLIGLGKGNPDWNFSAPHGAGRLMSRSQARRTINLEQYRESMAGIFSSTVNANTLDEAAFAYKPWQEIAENITESVDILERIKPVYNFKAAD
jgi:tRNA-splicing ligase RtcB (3'-phosphate/5'-hydroxy nucleic acid ligase)